VTLLFEVTELQAEIEAFGHIADELLAPGSRQVLRAASDELSGVSRSSTARRWQIRPENPLVTMPSYGSYMPDEEGGPTVHGEITFAWDLKPVRPSGDTRPAPHVQLDGVASTAIRLLRETPWSPQEERTELAVWRMEIADAKAPGTFFHVQVLGRESDVLFPKSLDVPRLPGVLNSPFACMEFVLGELFQDAWPKIAMRESGPGHRWRGIQAHRHAKHLAWAAEQVSGSSGSPWVMWKTAKPTERLFLRD
jgi:hypothetical protein